MRKYEKKELKQIFNNDKTAISRLINAWDPIGLATVNEAPDDEYDYEATRVLSAVYKVADIQELAREIQNIFNGAFGSELTQEQCLPIANQVWKETRG